MDGIIKDVTELSNKWYELISSNHHKDRDCHWYVETKWSYGQSPKYFVRHWGYILDNVEIPCDSYKEALEKLKEFLLNAIKEEKKYKEIDEESGW